MHEHITTQSGKNSHARIPWIDVSRGLAFLMVIYSHIPQCDRSVMRFFSPVFLTTFFFVSGYLFKRGKSFSHILEQRIRTLLIPFIVLGLIMIFMSHILTFNPEISLSDQIEGLLFQNGKNQILWFIAALFVYSVLFYFVDYLCKSVKTLLIFSTFLFAVNCITMYCFNITTVWHIYAFGFACFYMALGSAYREYENIIDRHVRWWMVLLCVVAYAALILVSDKEISFSGSEGILDSMILTVLGLIIVVGISKKYLHNSRLLLFVGANSLFYFAFHGKVYSLLLTMGEKVSYSTFHSENFWVNAVVAFSIVLLDAIILIPPSILVNKYLPQILGKKYNLWKTK